MSDIVHAVDNESASGFAVVGRVVVRSTDVGLELVAGLVETDQRLVIHDTRSAAVGREFFRSKHEHFTQRQAGFHSHHLNEDKSNLITGQ